MPTHTPQPTGLTPDEVLESRSLHGANVLTPPAKTPLWRLFLGKFADPLIIILLIAGALSVGIAIYEHAALGQPATVFFEPVGIFVAILLATGLAFHFERKADREFTLLTAAGDAEPVEVIRASNATLVPRSDVVVGDVVVLTQGCEVAADGELLEAVQLSVDESTLTGEPLCHKHTDPARSEAGATYPTNHVMKGTRVAEGHGLMRVLAVGDHTEQGRVYQAAQIDDRVRTPLNEQLDALSTWITRVSYAIAAAIVAGRLLMYALNEPFEWVPWTAYALQSLMIAVTLVVVAVPEGLPMAVTLSLAYSMRRMLKTHNLVRTMHACETMGAATVICTDKTGTLTANRMVVEEVLCPPALEALLREGMAVNSTAELDLGQPDRPAVVGNPTEGALLLHLRAHGIDYRDLRAASARLDELPFSTERKFMATLVESATLGRPALHIKGAPEIVAALCHTTPDDLAERLATLQRQGKRTLAFAYCEAPPALPLHEAPALPPATFLGVCSIADPVRPEVPGAIAECARAGIEVKMITGDNPLTASEIGRQIGLCPAGSPAAVMTGPEVAALSDDELRERVADIKIVARARPLDKQRLVRALRDRGEVVAVTGDGTNDAPALKAAHVGLSMGDGTAVAKEASDITILDNSFSTIGQAVLWGRSLYQNIQRFLLFQLTVNVTACLLVLCGAFMGTESPLTVTQMLWINLIMDTFAAMALASLPPSTAVMKDKPRDRKAFILNRPMLAEIAGVGGLFFALLLALLYVFQHADVTCLTDLAHLTLTDKGHVTPYELTLLFTLFVMTHFFYLFCARAFATHRSALHFSGCQGLLTIAAIIFVGQVAMVELPVLQQFFNVTSLKLTDWVIIVSASSCVLWVRELWQRVKKHTS